MKIKVNDISQGKLTEEQTATLEKYFKEGGTWQELFNLSAEEIESIYKQGYDHYQQEEYDKAISLFTSLIQMNPYREKHWLALGAALHGKELYYDALAAYELALALSEESIIALFYSAQAAWQLQDMALCRGYLERIVRQVARTEEEHFFHEKATLLLRSL